MKETIIGVVAVLALLVGVFAFFQSDKVTVIREDGTVVGNASSPSVIDGCMEVNGLTSCYHRISLNQASTTVCSIKSPVATSTLRHGSLKITTGTTTALILYAAKSTSFAASTTLLAGGYALASNAQVTLLASTSLPFASDGVLMFAPSTYLNFSYQGAAGSLNTLVGSCAAEFLVN